jgi:hypothetical protein
MFEIRNCGFFEAYTEVVLSNWESVISLSLVICRGAVIVKSILYIFDFDAILSKNISQFIQNQFGIILVIMP